MQLRTFVLAFLAAAVSVPAASVQRVEARFEAGVTAFADDAAERHLALGGALRAYLSRRWSVEPEFLYLRRNDSFVRDRDHLFWGNVAFDFRPRENCRHPVLVRRSGRDQSPQQLRRPDLLEQRGRVRNRRRRQVLLRLRLRRPAGPVRGGRWHIRRVHRQHRAYPPQVK